MLADTVAAIEAAAFRADRVRAFDLGPPWLRACAVLARRPAAQDHDVVIETPAHGPRVRLSRW